MSKRLLAVIVGCIAATTNSWGQPPNAICVEYYTDVATPAGKDHLLESLKKRTERNQYLFVRHRKVNSEKMKQRLRTIRESTHVQAELPLVYCLNGCAGGFRLESELEKALEQLLTVQVFSLENCVSCEYVPILIKQLSEAYPAITTEWVKIDSNRTRYEFVLNQHRLDPSAVKMPLIIAGGKVTDWAPGAVSAIYELRKVVTPWTAEKVIGTTGKTK